MGLEVFNPFELGSVRICIAGLAMLPITLMQGRVINRKQWGWLTVIGLFGNAIPAFLFPIAETVINSATAGMLNSLAPLFTLVLGVLLFGLKFSRLQAIGILVGLAGAVVLVLSRSGDVSLLQNVQYSMLVVLATVLYGTSTNIIKKYLQDLSPVLITAAMLCVVLLPNLIYVFYTDVPQMLMDSQAGAWQSLGYVAILALVCTCLALALFNWLVQLSDPVFAASVTYLIPLVALGWGLFAGEDFGWGHVVGMLIILLGVWLTTRKKSGG